MTDDIETLLRNPAKVLDLLDEIDRLGKVPGAMMARVSWPNIESIRYVAECALLGERPDGRYCRYRYGSIAIEEAVRVAAELRDVTRAERERAGRVANARLMAAKGYQ